MSYKILPLAFALLLAAMGRSQVKMDEEFVQMLDQAGIEFIQPVEARYKPAPLLKNPFQPYGYAIRSRKEGLEIRYIIRPYDPNLASADIPHVEAARLVSHLASNEQDYLIAGREIAPEVLAGYFNADWGIQYFFRPKKGFAAWNHCELLALHKDGRGTAFVLFLFDEPSRELGNRFYALQFRGEEGPGAVR